MLEATWTLRAFICGRLAGLQLNNITITLEKEDYKAEIFKYSPTGLAPVLLLEKLLYMAPWPSLEEAMTLSRQWSI